jgi:hypothetical protein
MCCSGAVSGRNMRSFGPHADGPGGRSAVAGGLRQPFQSTLNALYTPLEEGVSGTFIVVFWPDFKLF